MRSIASPRAVSINTACRLSCAVRGRHSGHPCQGASGRARRRRIGLVKVLEGGGAQGGEGDSKARLAKILGRIRPSGDVFDQLGCARA